MPLFFGEKSFYTELDNDSSTTSNSCNTTNRCEALPA